ncbi:metallophosphoesterase [Bradyrhizobium sp. CCBAU 53380]|uniref:metallophosphoesterase n=1 Tax=Bradyrhizobium sp. CCBAU 53380 TaxID=1325117 RepID=UPI002304709D|nr:metallophosphoesterase [Bradyrhizobium sp. CCBAU 53380]MDA9420962.1 metallophosphoesterase [Bradyrhizobium sp. CCBAU 53380]
MRLWVMSDLHIELTRGWDLPSGDARPQFDVMIVAGDLMPRAERGVKWLLERVPDRHVIYVMGNHEAYGEDIDRTLEKAKEIAAGTNVHVLENESVRIGDVTFAGCTLWTDFALFGDERREMAIAAERMNDFRKIRTARYAERFRPAHALARHRRSRTFLEAEFRKDRPGPVVIVTHHACRRPELRLSDPPAPDELLSAAYYSDLTNLMVPAPDDGRGALRPADLWIHGHTHSSFDAVIGGAPDAVLGGTGTRVLSNPKGYGPWPPREPSWENQDFNEKLIIEI